MRLVAVPADLTGSFTLGDVLAPVFADVGQVAKYDFTALPGQRVYLVPISGDPADYTWSLEDSAGRSVQALSTDLNLAGPYWLVGGDYTLTVDPIGGAVGPVSFRLTDPVDTAVAASMGDVIVGALNDPADTHTTTFSAPPGRLLTIDQQAASSVSAMGYELLDQAGREIIPLTDNFQDTTAVPLVGGSYQLIVHGEGDTTGTFTYQLVNAGSSAFAPSGTPMSLDSDVLASVTGGVPERHLLTLATTTEVFFRPARRPQRRLAVGGL